MSTTTLKYEFTDDGIKYKIEYDINSCLCFQNCNDDVLRIYEDGEEDPYTIDIVGGDMKWFIRALLDNELKIKEVK